MPDAPNPTAPATSQPAPGASPGTPAEAATTPQPATPGADSGAAAGAPQEPSPKELNEFVKARRGLREKGKELRNGFAQLEAQRKALAEKDAEREKELADLRARVEKWEKGNPLEHVEDPSKVVRDYVEKTAPERQIAQLWEKNKELEAKLAQRDKDFEAREAEKERKAAEERDAQLAQRRAHANAQEQAAFTRLLRSRAAEFPEAHELYSDEEIASQAAQIQAWALKNNRPVPVDDALKFLNKQAAAVLSQREERRKALQSDPQRSSSTEHSGKKPPPGNGRRESGPAPAATPKRPPARMTRAEEEAHDLAMLRDAQARDRADREKQERLNGAARKS